MWLLVTGKCKIRNKKQYNQVIAIHEMNGNARTNVESRTCWTLLRGALQICWPEICWTYIIKVGVCERKKERAWERGVFMCRPCWCRLTPSSCRRVFCGASLTTCCTHYYGDHCYRGLLVRKEMTRSQVSTCTVYLVYSTPAAEGSTWSKVH